MRALLLVAASMLLAGCALTPEPSAAETSSPNEPPAAGTPGGGSGPSSSSTDPPDTPTPSSTLPTSAGAQGTAAPSSLRGVYRVAVDSATFEAEFRPDGTLTWRQEADGESGTFEGTYDLARGRSVVGDQPGNIQVVHEDLVILSDVYLRRVLADGSVALAHSDERIIGDFSVRDGGLAGDYRFFADGTWVGSGSFLSDDFSSASQWEGSGRYDLTQGVLAWDRGLNAGSQERLIRWMTHVVVIGDQIARSDA